MREGSKLIREKAAELLEKGEVTRVLGWKAGELICDRSPAFFYTAAQTEGLLYDGFCAANLSKLFAKSETDGKTLLFLKPCDTYSFNQLALEHKLEREKAHIVGVMCDGMLDERKIRDKGIRVIKGVAEASEQVTVYTPNGEETFPREELLLEKCISCKSKKHVAYDELITDENAAADNTGDRFKEVLQLESKTPEERFEFWKGELSRCIRCNACREVCPACTCVKCVFDNSHSGVRTKASSDSFEDSLYHIIRAYHVAGRCTDCGECSRACPKGIPLHLINRKIIKDINLLYGEYQAGESPDARAPLVSYTAADAEPDVVSKHKGVK